MLSKRCINLRKIKPHDAGDVELTPHVWHHKPKAILSPSTKQNTYQRALTIHPFRTDEQTANVVLSHSSMSMVLPVSIQTPKNLCSLYMLTTGGNVPQMLRKERATKAF